ncbi:hypothetical protein AB0I10_13230 [Streptomyces sp. NPDC050636]|uniref:hypothetical protein n=1 Tax=Streptomyces sp. NPDC050636 TaxID=3154510 RepID=UPI003449FD60
MTTEARTDSRAADAFHTLQLALAGAEMMFPELTFSDAADGEIRVNRGRVGIRTAANLARALKAAWS